MRVSDWFEPATRDKSMSVAAVAAESGEKFGGKAELAARLTWTRDRLDRFLAQHPDFPVVHRASKGVPWRFDIDAALAYVEAAEAKQKGNADPTPRSRHELAKAVEVEDRNRIRRGELVEAEEVRAAIATMLAVLSKSLDGAADEIGQELNLTETQILKVRELLDAKRVAAATELEGLDE